MDIIAFDSHKRYTLVYATGDDGQPRDERRIEHAPGAIRNYLARFQPGSPVAVETIGNWYWILGEIEQAGMRPQLVNARRAKLLMGNANKTDRLDARGLNILQRNNTLPSVWIPPAELRDQRDLPRTRMSLVSQRSRIKNRIHATMAKYNLNAHCSDPFGKKGRAELRRLIKLLPEHTRFTTEILLAQVDQLDKQVELIDKRIEEVFVETEQLRLLRSMPGVGFVLGIVIMLEIGDVGRFASAGALASYSGTVPRIHASGGKTRYGKLRADVNRYLKWAFVEAASAVSIHRKTRPDRYASVLYGKIRARKGHQKAVGAVARHLAESAYWVLTRREEYKERGAKGSLPTRA